MAKERIITLLYELMKNSRRSDRDLATIIKVSQPTITRTRKKLEKMGFIRYYTVMPELTKLGFELAAFTFFNIVDIGVGEEKERMQMKKKAQDWIAKNQKIILAASGDGLHGKNTLVVSLHKNYTDYSNFIAEFRKLWFGYVDATDTFLVPLSAETLKPFSWGTLERIKITP